MSIIRRSVTTVGSLYALMRQRLRLNVKTPLLTQEISATSAPDRPLVVSTLTPIAGWPVDHGTVADEAAMLALHTLDSTTLLTEPTFVAPGDSCLRADDPDWRWHCISGHGTTLADWERRPLAGALSGLALSGHTHPLASLAEVVTALEGKQAASANLTALAVVASSAVGRALLAIATPSGPKIPQLNADGTVTPIDVPSGGGSGGLVATTDSPPDQERSFGWVSNGDANGYIYYRGANDGTAAWSNPHTSGRVTVVRSSDSQGSPAVLVDRSGGKNCHTNDGIGEWVCVDLGANHSIRPSDYTLRNRGQYNGYPLRNWKLQGSNDVAGNTVSQINAATWTDLDIRTNDIAQADAADAWGKWSLTPPATAYRWLRVLCTEPSGYYLCIAEVEVYGLAVASVPLPAGALGWMTDGVVWAPYYARST